VHSSQQCSVQRDFCNRIHRQLRLVTFVGGGCEAAPQQPLRIDRIVMRFAVRIATSQIFPFCMNARLPGSRLEFRFESIG